jgi:drug/metabolite transporter (DMT)-like permease
MAGSALAFSVMALLVKLATRRVPAQEVVLVRGLVTLLLSYLTLRTLGLAAWGRHHKLLVLRGLAGFIALSCFFVSLHRLPLSVATVLHFTTPMFTALLAALLLGERLSPVLGLSLLLSSCGVLAVIHPASLWGAGPGIDLEAVALAVTGAFFSGCAYVTVRKLARLEHPAVTVFYFPLVSVPATLPFVLDELVWPTAAEWLILLGVGVFTQIGQVLLTAGLSRQPAGPATSVSYLQIVFAALWGLLFFAEVPDAWTISGATLIFTGTAITAAWPRRG